MRCGSMAILLEPALELDANQPRAGMQGRFTVEWIMVVRDVDRSSSVIVDGIAKKKAREQEKRRWKRFKRFLRLPRKMVKGAFQYIPDHGSESYERCRLCRGLYTNPTGHCVQSSKFSTPSAGQ